MLAFYFWVLLLPYFQKTGFFLSTLCLFILHASLLTVSVDSHGAWFYFLTSFTAAFRLNLPQLPSFPYRCGCFQFPYQCLEQLACDSVEKSGGQHGMLWWHGPKTSPASNMRKEGKRVKDIGQLGGEMHHSQLMVHKAHLKEYRLLITLFLTVFPSQWVVFIKSLI